MTLRVLITTDAVGGVWQYATDLAAALVPHGIETLLAILGPAPSIDQRHGAQAIPGLTLIDTGLPLDWLCDGAEPVLAAGNAIAALAKRERVDLVHLNMPTLAAEVHFAVPVVAVAHGCVGTWWEAAHGGAPDAEYGWILPLIRAGLLAADVVIAPSASYAATVERYHDLPRSPLSVHNGRAPIGPPTKVPPADHALTVGRLWDRVKNAPLLDRVAAGLPVPFRAAGTIRGPHGESIALDHLDLLGQLPTAALARELAMRPIFVSAATFEPFGLAVLEAASAGCALILSDIDTFRELWTGAALIVADDDAEAYIAAIRRVRDDAVLRADLGDAAKARAERYSPAAMGEAMASVYRSTIASAAAPRRVAA